MSECDFDKAEISDSPAAANSSLTQSTDDQEAEESCRKPDKELGSAAQASTSDGTDDLAECAGSGAAQEGATNANSSGLVDAAAISHGSLEESAGTHPTPRVETCGQEADKVSESATQASTQDVSEGSLEAVTVSDASLEEPPKLESPTQASTPDVSEDVVDAAAVADVPLEESAGRLSTSMEERCIQEMQKAPGVSAEVEECSGSTAEQSGATTASSEVADDDDDVPVSRARRKEIEWQNRVQAKKLREKEEVIEKRAAKLEFEQARIRKEKEDLVSLDKELGAIEARMLRRRCLEQEDESPPGPEDEVFDARTNSRRRLHEQLLQLK